MMDEGSREARPVPAICQRRQPMTSAELLADSFGRIREVVHHVLDGSPEQLALRLDSEANSIGW